MNLTVDDIVATGYAGASNIDRLRGRKFKGVSTDSRTVKPGELFIALRGDSFDGNMFVRDAVERGAACAILEKRSRHTPPPGFPFVMVTDTTKTLGALARLYRRKFSIPVMAVGGSNGKTSTKEMIAAVLGTKEKVLCTKGNLNNHVGVPQTLFQLRPKHTFAVIEVGTNHFGELKYLCAILEPTHGLITNIGREHLEFFKNLNGVARAEGELFDHLAGSGTGFVNVDDKYLVKASKKLKRKVTYGFSTHRAQVQGIFQRMDSRGCAEFAVRSLNKKTFVVKLSTPGKHAMANGLSAAAVGLAFSVPPSKIQQALASFHSVGKRMEVLTVGGVVILNDTYNANPDSVLAAMETLRSMKCKGKKILILADMLELGSGSRIEHERIGESVNDMGFEYLLTYGPLGKFIQQKATAEVNLHYDQKNVLSEFAAELILPGDIVLVKGSRGMRMEDVVAFLQERLQKRAA